MIATFLHSALLLLPSRSRIVLLHMQGLCSIVEALTL